MKTQSPPPTTGTRVLVVTQDVLAARMAGPAIRSFEIARELSKHNHVTLVSMQRVDLKTSEFRVEFADETRLKTLIETNDVLIFQGHLLSHYPWISQTDIIVVADIYDPMQLEILEQGRDFGEEVRLDHTLSTIESLNTQMERADYLLCASEKQRDFWLGHLSALSRVNPLTYDDDPSLRRLIDVAPFGIPSSPAHQTRHAIKGNVPGITSEDRVILWGGGIYNWFDPLTLIHAVARLSLRHPDLRLFFLGLQHPNPDVPMMRMATEAVDLSRSLGLLNRFVFFNQAWVAYEDRSNYLLDADLGVSTHFDHVETAFSFRTRLLDYLWAGLPIVSTEGDVFSPLIHEHGLGLTVPPEDSHALALAIEAALYDDRRHQLFRRNIERYRANMTWERALAPIEKFCQHPSHAADFRAGVQSPRSRNQIELRERLHAIENSTIWRLSSPLRKLVNRRARE